MDLCPRLRIHGSVSVTKMMRAFTAAGLEWKHDKRTNEIVAFPAVGADVPEFEQDR